MVDRLVLFGGGGHAKVVLDIIREAGQADVVGILDDDPARQGGHFHDIPVLGGLEVLADPSFDDRLMLVAVGDNAKREAVVRRLEALGVRFARAIHPRAHLARDVSVGPGTVIMAGVVINPDTAIGAHVIVNTAASIDHDCQIEDFAHVSPGVHLAGGVRVGRGAHLGIGACAIPGVRIGARAIVGAGAVVAGDVAADLTVVGVPAKPLRPGPDR